ncbi:MAG: PD40 domain-containing protein [Armatimonadetes bacterium]|nr:PD40 domain-containing protein [Anaerolineae bacterium]
MPDPKRRLLLDDDDAFVDQEPQAAAEPPPAVINADTPTAHLFDDPPLRQPSRVQLDSAPPAVVANPKPVKGYVQTPRLLDDPLPPPTPFFPRGNLGSWVVVSVVLLLVFWQMQDFVPRPLTLFYGLMNPGDTPSSYTYLPYVSPVPVATPTTVPVLRVHIPDLKLLNNRSRFPETTPEVGAPDTVADDWRAGNIEWGTSDQVRACYIDQVTAGERIVYLDRPSNFSISSGGTLFITSPGGTDRCQLSPLNIVNGDTVRWSADGQRVAFTMTVDITQIYTMAQGDRAPTLLTADCEYSVQPDWSPNGVYIAFKGICDKQPGIYLFNRDTKTVRQLASEGEYPTWSSDGRRILYYFPQVTADLMTYGGYFYSVEIAAGSEPQFLGDMRIQGAGFKLQPDTNGNMVVRGSGTELQLVDLNRDFTTGYRIGTFISPYTAPDWLPHRNRVAFLASASATDLYNGPYAIFSVNDGQRVNNGQFMELQRHSVFMDIAAFDWYSAP